MKIVYIGCVKTSAVFLKKLLSLGADIAGIVTKRESAFNADFEELGPIAAAENIRLHYTKNVNDQDTSDFIRDCGPDIIFCFGWSQLIHPQILKLPPRGVIGFHPARLPYNRGRHPIIWALALGLSSTASTFFVMDAGADTGKIIAQDPVAIAYEDDAQSLYDKITDTACHQLERLMEQFANGTVVYTAQNPEAGNSWRKRGRDDGKIDWRMSGYMIYNLVRALTHPYVGAHFVYQGKEYKVWKARERRDAGWENIEPGKVLSVYSPTGFLVKAGECAVEILDCDPVALKPGDYILE